MLSGDIPNSPENQVIVASDTPFEETGEVFNQLHVAMTDLEHIDEVISQAVDVSDELMDEQAAIDQAQEEGASQVALESLQRNVNSLLKQVGIEERVNFSALALNNKRYNKIALESAGADILAFLNRIWDAIKAAISKTMDIVKDVFKKYFDASIKIKKNCEIIKAKAISLKGKTHRSAERVGGAHIAKYLRFNNRAIEPQQLIGNYDRWMSHNYDFVAAIAGRTALGEYRARLEKLSDYFSGISTSTTLNEIKRETDAFGDLMIERIVSNFQFHRNGEHTTVPFIGDVVFKFDESNLSFSIESIEKLKDLGSQNTHVPLDTSEVVIMCDKLIQHMKYYDQINTYFDQLDSFSKMTTEIANSAIANKADLNTAQRKAISLASSFIVRIFVDAIRKVGVGARKYDMQVSSAIVQWCAVSVNTL